jgi:DNA topoisomerase-2
MWTHDKETNRMVQREVTFVPGFFKIVDEILVNAADHKVPRFPICFHALFTQILD